MIEVARMKSGYLPDRWIPAATAGHEIPMYFWEEAHAARIPISGSFWLVEWDARMHLNFDAPPTHGHCFVLPMMYFR